MTDKLQVRVLIGKPGVCHSNILWPGKRWPMRAGRFPAEHPCGQGNNSRDAQFGNSGGIAEFRARGYWASCFPEGDGITFSSDVERSREQVVADVRECFGFEVLE